MLKSEAAKIHEVCARCLEGLVDNMQLAIHHEKAGLHEAARPEAPILRLGPLLTPLINPGSRYRCGESALRAARQLRLQETRPTFARTRRPRFSS